MKKKLLFSLIGIILTTGLYSKASAAKPKYVYISVNSSRIRSEGSIQSKSLKVISRGYKIKIISETELWYEVEFEENKKGWILKRNVTYETPQVKKITALQKSLRSEIEKKEALVKKLKTQEKVMKYKTTKVNGLQNSIIHLNTRAEELEKKQSLTLMLGGVFILLLGWGLGFITGAYRKQANERKYLEMMLEAHPSTANMLKKKATKA